MELFQAVITATVDLFKIPITIFGVTFSLWQVLLFSAFVSVVVWILREVFLGD